MTYYEYELINLSIFEVYFKFAKQKTNLFIPEIITAVFNLIVELRTSRWFHSLAEWWYKPSENSCTSWFCVCCCWICCGKLTLIMWYASFLNFKFNIFCINTCTNCQSYLWLGANELSQHLVARGVQLTAQLYKHHTIRLNRYNHDCLSHVSVDY